MTVRMPGTVDGDVSGGSIDPDGADTGRIFATRLDAASPTPVTVASSTREVAALVWRGWRSSLPFSPFWWHSDTSCESWRPERRGKSKKPAAPKPKEPKPVINATEVAEPESADDDLPAVVALDGMGVLYRQGDDINQLLVPFVRQRGSEVSHDKIVARARAMSLGRITAAEFWAGVGLDGDPNEARRRLPQSLPAEPGRGPIPALPARKWRAGRLRHQRQHQLGHQSCEPSTASRA
ncbi:MAG: hypothetical protein R2710_24245 [Acidimicrobiales bacterium]